MQTRADLVAYDRLGSFRVLVEVKNKPAATVAWATEFRRNLCVHGRLPRADYFVVATPLHLHVWRDSAPADAPPAVSVSAGELWMRYSGDQVPSPGSGEAFELVVASWLSDAARDWDRAKPHGDDARRLEETGLPQAIRGGHVEHGIAA